MDIKLIGFFIQIFIFIFFIRRFVPLKEINKIGALNLILISTYIILNIYYFGNKFDYLPVLPYRINIYIELPVLFMILYRLINLNVEIDYVFKKGEKEFRYFQQSDKRWRSIPYGISTIGQSGCGLSVLAMVQSVINKNITPEEIGRWVSENYPQTRGTNISTMAKYLNFIELENNYLPRNANLSSEMKVNTVICVWWKNYPDRITKFKFLSRIFGGGHFVMLYAIHGNKAYIADPSNYAGTIKPMSLAKLIKKVNNHSQGVTHPYISVCFA